MPKKEKKMKFNNKVIDMTNIDKKKEEELMKNTSGNIDAGVDAETNKDEEVPEGLPANSTRNLGF